MAFVVSIIVESVAEQCAMTVVAKNQVILSWAMKIQFVCVLNVMNLLQMMSKLQLCTFCVKMFVTCLITMSI